MLSDFMVTKFSSVDKRDINSNASSFLKFNQTRCNVVTANSLTRANVFGAGGIYDCLCTFLEIVIAEFALLKAAFIDVFVAPGNSLFRGHAVPETIASKKNELTGSLKWNHFDVGACSHSLVFGFHGRILFIFKIAESTGEGKLAVNATVLNKAVCIVDALAL
jgi:hypothetical protein